MTAAATWEPPAVLETSVMLDDDDIIVDEDDDRYVIAFNPERNLTSPGPYQSMLCGGRVACQVARHLQL